MILTVFGGKWKLKSYYQRYIIRLVLFGILHPEQCADIYIIDFDEYNGGIPSDHPTLSQMDPINHSGDLTHLDYMYLAEKTKFK